MTIDKNTLLGTSMVKNITYNTASVALTSGTTVGSILYSQNVI